MNVFQVVQMYQKSLSRIYHEGELSQLIFMVFEQVKRFSKTDLVLRRDEQVSHEEAMEFESILSELESHKPIQYVLGYAWFYDLKLKVNSSVMIPRQETEELVHWIIDEVENKEKGNHNKLRILDVCTGSGCIAIALKKNVLDSDVTAVDHSEKALDIAKENAGIQQTGIRFLKDDVLQLSMSAYSSTDSFDVIVSNPPYILEKEKAQMKKKELDFEPHTAFFVNDSDPLIFYRRIAEFALAQLRNKGKLYFEINEKMGKEVVDLLIEKGFTDVCLKKDLNGKDRMVRAIAKTNHQ